MNNPYKLKARLLKSKYEPFAEEFKQHNDDRILVPNILAQVLEACAAMESVENNLVRVAINEKIREEDAEMEKIVTRFTGQVFDGTKWQKKEEDAAERRSSTRTTAKPLPNWTRSMGRTSSPSTPRETGRAKPSGYWSTGPQSEAFRQIRPETMPDGSKRPPMMRKTSSTTATASSMGRTDDEGEEKP